MCKCNKPIKPGNATLVLVNDKYYLTHKTCEHQLELDLRMPQKPPKPWELPQLEG
jgi:hypothetical protein